ncbi:MAG TPA: acyl-CoA dehydrogenase family protein [Thermoanaerobaculia bacterium]|nr:acyl-CoA dehydrogenase family protein [Thermoanaerobaculia bacterium]
MRPPTIHVSFPRPSLPVEVAALRHEIRELLEEERRAGTWQPGGKSWGEYNPALTRKIAERGWIGLTWPKRYGGKERTQLERYVVTEELLAAGAPAGAHWVADRQSGPLLLRFGTEEQRLRFLPPITRGEIYFCIGMSEPDSGSDLASIRSRAVKVDGGWRLSGTKIWTSWAHHCHYMITLCRTEPPSADRHAGMSQLIVDLHAQGVSIRPIRNLTGEHEFNEIVFDETFVADEDVVGEPGGGWHQVTSELAYERSGPERFLTNFHLLRRLVDGLGQSDRAASEHGLRELGRLAGEVWALRAMSLSVAGALERGETPAVEAALVKDLGTHFQQELPDAGRRLVDQEGIAEEALRDELARATQLARAYTIQGGTTEILRGIIARGLKLR